jgi:hypothetical protein
VYSVEFDDQQFVPGSDGELFVSVTDNDLNDGVAQAQIIGPDSPAPTDPKLKVGSVDVSAGTVAQVNRQPELLAQSLNSDQLVVNDTQNKVINQRSVNGDHPDFSTAQDAIDFASNNDYNIVKFPPGSFSSITIPGDIKVVGSGQFASQGSFSGTEFRGAPTVSVVGDRAELKNCFLDTGGTVALEVDGSDFYWRVSGCRINGNVEIGLNTQTRRGVLAECFLSNNDITLGANSEENVVDTNTRVATITDNGSENVIGDNSG